MTIISLFNKSDLSLHKHAMYEHYASDYESTGPVYFRGPLQDSHLIIDNRLWRYNVDHTTTVMNYGRIVNISISLFMLTPSQYPLGGGGGLSSLHLGPP